MKNKIVEHIAGNARQALTEVEDEVIRLRDSNQAVFSNTREGAGLDLAVLREKLKAAQDLVDLLL